jgi:ribonuclease HI
MSKLIIYTDGGARGNPGPAGIGVVIKKGDETHRFKRYIGEATNNQAEYRAVILALEKAKDLGGEELEFYLDSELVVKQLNREYRVKDADLAPLFVEIHNRSLAFKKITWRHVRRELNKEADKLVNEAIDEYLK